MKCSQCGVEIPQGNGFCTGCGARVEQVASTSAQKAFCNKCGGNLVNGGCPNCANELNGIFKSTDEQVIQTLGTRGHSKCFCAVSNKRVYFVGKSFNIFMTSQGESYRDNLGDKCVSLKNITDVSMATAKSHKNYQSLKAVAILFLAVCVIAAGTYFLRKNAIDNKYSSPEATVGSVIGSISGNNRVMENYNNEMETLNSIMMAFAIFIALLFWVNIITFIIYKATDKRMIKVKCSGGVIGVMASCYDNREVNSFINALQLSIPKAQEVVQPVIVAQPVAIPTSVSSSADELSKYADLLDRGLINREEFDKFKAGLLNK